MILKKARGPAEAREDGIFCGLCRRNGRRKMLCGISENGLLLYCKSCREPVLLTFGEIDRIRAGLSGGK